VPSLGSVVVPTVVVPALASSPVVVGLVLVVGVSPVVVPAAVVVPALTSVAAVGSVVGMVVGVVLTLPSSPQATRPRARVSMVVREVSARIFR